MMLPSVTTPRPLMTHHCRLPAGLSRALAAHCPFTAGQHEIVSFYLQAPSAISSYQQAVARALLSRTEMKS